MADPIPAATPAATAEASAGSVPPLPFGTCVLIRATVIRVVPIRGRWGGWSFVRLADPRDPHSRQRSLASTWPGLPIPDPDGDGYDHLPVVSHRVKLRRLPCPPERGLFLDTCVRLEGEPGGQRSVRLYEVALPPAQSHLPFRLVRVWPADCITEVSTP